MVYREEGKRGLARWQKAALVLVGMALVLLLFREPLMVQAGRALVARDEVKEADVIVVLMGSLPDRVVHGAELFKKGYADRLVMVRTREYEDYEIMETLDLEIPGPVDLNLDVARQLGVQEEDVVILDEGSDSTYDEAVAMRGYLEETGEDSMILVTSKYHSARSKKTFERVLGEEVRIISSPSPHDFFEPEGWWKCRTQTRNVILEYQKFLNLYLFQW